VILLNGLARISSAMANIEQALLNEDFYVINKGYPSRKYTREVLAELVIDQALGQCPKNTFINIVTHFLGERIVRQYLSDKNILNLNRSVMLTPPNKGSEVVDKRKDLHGLAFYQWRCWFNAWHSRRQYPENTRQS
jgi:hypothetical protein